MACSTLCFLLAKRNFLGWAPKTFNFNWRDKNLETLTCNVICWMKYLKPGNNRITQRCKRWHSWSIKKSENLSRRSVNWLRKRLPKGETTNLGAFFFLQNFAPRLRSSTCTRPVRSQAIPRCGATSTTIMYSIDKRAWDGCHDCIHEENGRLGNLAAWSLRRAAKSSKKTVASERNACRTVCFDWTVNLQRGNIARVVCSAKMYSKP